MEQGIKALEEVDRHIMLKRPRQKVLAWCAVAFLAIVSIFLVVSPGSVCNSALDIRLRVIQGADSTPALEVLVSNRSEIVILYYPSVEIAMLKNGLWETNSSSHASGGIGSVIMILQPGQSDRTYSYDIAVPGDEPIKAIRAGLSFSCLSWRGKLANALPGWRVLSPFSSWLYDLDRAQHSKTEWSDVLFLASATNSGGLKSDTTVFDFVHLLSASPNSQERIEIARINLFCAQGLPGAENLDIGKSLQGIDRMARRVRSETERHFYRFQRNPTEFENSDGFFRMVMLMVVLTEDFRVEYAPNRMARAASTDMNDGFFADPSLVFLHGLTGANPQGTCSSLPVLQVAVGRRLGYPLKLVTTKGHLFVRWEDARERFNFEAAGQGANRFPDDYYRHWPFDVTEEEVQAEGYLKSLTAPEELVVFLSIRGMCLAEASRFAESAESFAAAARLSPHCRSYRLMQVQMEQKTEVNDVGLL